MDGEIKRRIEDLMNRSVRTNQPTATGFLDPAELAEARLFLKSEPGARYVVCGGFEGAERSRLIFIPDYYDENCFPAEEYIAVIRAECSFGNLTHRDWLGSVMGLGVKRDALGDILVCDGYADIICTDKIAQYLADNLIKVGRYGVKTHMISMGEIVPPNPKFDVRTGTVASLRADAVVALAFGISRTNAVSLIREGRLSVDHLPEQNTSAEIEEGVLLSLRGFGRAKLARVGGTSKKGRIFLEFNVFSKK